MVMEGLVKKVVKLNNVTIKIHIVKQKTNNI